MRKQRTSQAGTAGVTLVGVIWIAVVLWFFYDSFKNSMAEAGLLQRGQITTGVVTAADEEMERADSGNKIWDHYITYRFRLPNGQVLEQHQSGSGRLHDSLRNTPCRAQVIYLPDNPSVSRVFCSELPKAETWFARKFIKGILFLGVFLTPAILILIKGIRERETAQATFD